MRSRKLADGVRSSARLRSKNCPATRAASAQEVDVSKSTKTVCLASSHKATERRTSKTLKYEKDGFIKSELRELTTKKEKTSLSKTASETSSENGPLERAEHKALPPSNEANTSKICEQQIERNENGLSHHGHSREVGNSCLTKTENDLAPSKYKENLLEEDMCKHGAVLLGEAGSEADPQKTPCHIDSSIFLDEDSNQPMPVNRFFGNVELMQDLPPVSPPCPSMSRREFRKMHFRAKDDDDDDAEM
ncbi:UPF0688 protein C1orf174-like [Vombatus ursinus]|uniref:CA174 protein n=1 Tax=Vombatus ursinus TaxID=29139 RepID=A0A4X2MBF2_VOMUR|nr:UPF0688 protein C1orf174 homolog [Vombatus ursinus]XP_027699612.1 UPF0688 protein C1orf174-like [Vombatus ursinus]